MMVTETINNINLSQGQAQFASLIESYPKYAVYWDWVKKECDPDAISQALPAMSHGEQIMLKFFWSVWTHNNQDFDFIEAASILDDDQMAIITTWMADPFWP